MARPKRVPRPDAVRLAEHSALAPLIFFDQAMTFGVCNGVAHITLEAFSYSSVDGEVKTERVIVAELRTGSRGLDALKAAIAGIELLATEGASKVRN